VLRFAGFFTDLPVFHFLFIALKNHETAPVSGLWCVSVCIVLLTNQTPVFLFDTAITTSQCPIAEENVVAGDVFTYSDSCYHFFNSKPDTWDNAQQYCQRRGGSLVWGTSPAFQVCSTCGSCLFAEWVVAVMTRAGYRGEFLIRFL
jgi:hypothetical protein